MDELVHITEHSNLPLSSNQKRIWIISQMYRSNPAYNLGFTCHLKGDLNYGLFQESMNVLFNRHHTMFSVFKQKDGNPYCEIIPKQVTIDLIDFSEEQPDTGKRKIYSFDFLPKELKT